MDDSRWHIRSLILRLLEFLLKLYPARFRREFSLEIQEIVLSRVREAEKLGWLTWMSAVFQETMGLIPSIVQEYWHELRSAKEGVMVHELHLPKGGFHTTMAYLRWADPPLWMITLADSLPLWLLSVIFIDISIGLFPYGPGLESFPFLIVIAVTILLLWMGWFTPELILYSLFPIIPTMIFEEIPPDYKLSFFLLCTFILTTGIVGYRLSLHRDSIGLGWLILLGVFIGTWMLAAHASQNYWQMPNETSWWVIFFTP